MALLTVPFGPFVRGVIDTQNPSLDPKTSLFVGRNLMYSGLSELGIRPGTRVQLTLLDDETTPAPITSVVAIKQFADGALAVGHSTVTDKCYLYRLNATLDGWYDVAGVLTTPATSAEPVGVLWSSMANSPDVQIDEGLGTAYIANTGALDELGLYWPTKKYSDFNSISDLLVNGSAGSEGADVAYATGVVSFKQHLWIFGYGAGDGPGFTSYRPELAKFSRPNFLPFQTVDSITIGDKVRSQRERIIAGAAAGDALYLGGASLVVQITGSGRDSWFRRTITNSYGFVGPKCFVVVDGVLYYWSPRGPMRISGSNADPLWDAIPAAVSKVANIAKITAGFDIDRDQVLFFYDTGNGVRTFCAFDTRREVWLGPDSDIGLPVACAGLVEPVYKSTAVAPIGPSAPPVIVSTTSVGNTTALATWTNGDATAQTEVSYKLQSGSTWTTLPLQAAGNTTYTFSGLIPGNSYEWRIRHIKNGQQTDYDGPETSSRFITTSVTLLPPSLFAANQINPPNRACQSSWTPSGESGVSTEIWIRNTFIGEIDFYKVATVGPGQSSANFTAGAYGSHQGKCRHVRSGSVESDFSNTYNFTVSNLT